MNAYVVLPKIPGRYGSNTMPMPLEDAVRLALENRGRGAKVYRARPVTARTSQEMLEGRESFLTDDLLVEVYADPTADDRAGSSGCGE